MARDDRDEPPADEAAAPENPFALVGNEIRAEMLRVIADAGELSFSELRSRTDPDLDSARTNYHLQQLVGPLVKKTDGGYQLHAAGYRVNRALQAVTFPRGDRRSVDADFDCHHCQTRVVACFDSGFVTVQCPGCDYEYFADIVEPPLETFVNDRAAFEHVSAYTQHKILAYARSICPLCGNAVETTMLPPDNLPRPKAQHRDVAVYRSCEHCDTEAELTVGMALLTDLGIQTFCAEHGVDVLSTPAWELEFAATDSHLTVRSTDPWEVALRVQFGGDTLEVVVDGESTIVERNRVGVADDGSRSVVSDIQGGGLTAGSNEGVDETDLPANAACLESLRRQRWPDGVTCPHCSGTDTIKEGTTGKDAQRYRCQRCDSIFNDLTGTVFAERGLTLPEMFYIIRAMEDNQTTEIARQVDRSYKSVLDFVHEVQNATGGDIGVALSADSGADDTFASAGENGSN